MIVTKSALKEIRKKYAGQKIVFTRGSYDLIHPGHIDFLKESRALGDVLVVGLTPDRDIAIRKGRARPVLPLDQRMINIDAIRYVDYVLPIHQGMHESVNVTGEDTRSVLKNLRPDFFTSANKFWVTKAQHMKRYYGTHFVLVDVKKVNSTTDMIKKAAEIYSLSQG